MKFAGTVGSCSLTANEQMIKFWWRSGSSSGYRDCFSTSILLRDGESLTVL